MIFVTAIILFLWVAFVESSLRRIWMSDKRVFLLGLAVYVLGFYIILKAMTWLFAKG